jgi:phenylalanyl-tRNA synthetase beta chain
MKAHTSYINSCTGLSLSSTEVIPLLERMTLTASQSSADPDEILVEVPPTRPDILHECDIMEDAAIAYGFNKLPDTFPATNTVAQPLEMSKLTDIVRTTWAQAGFVEVLPLILVGSKSLIWCTYVSSCHALPLVLTRRKLRMY